MAYDYDLVVIGGGAAGLTASALGATLGASVAMIEREKLGGDCTWYGCVPSKTLLKAAKVAHYAHDADRYGLKPTGTDVPFDKVIKYIDHVRREVYDEADRPEIYEDLGIEVVQGSASFTDEHTVDITSGGDIRTITGRYFVIAAGASAFVPPIKGINDVPYLTNENIFDLDAQPARLAIVGGGPIGTEMAQSFRRLGTDVTVIDMLPRILSNDDPELTGILFDRLESEGVRFELEAGVKEIKKAGSDINVVIERDGKTKTVAADALLMATGRRANLKDLNLEAAGVEVNKAGIQVDDKCRTSRRHIYASGDVTGRFQFTHMSEHMSKVAVTNALVKFPMKIDTRHVPWVTYADPEIAHVGATEEKLREKGTSYRTYRFPFSKIDRAITESETEGLIKVHARARDGKIYGASVAGASAGEMICSFALAMRNGISLRKISDTIHPYPTYGLGVRRAADQWYVQKQSPTLVRIIKAVFRYRGPVHEFGPDQIL